MLCYCYLSGQVHFPVLNLDPLLSMKSNTDLHVSPTPPHSWTLRLILVFTLWARHSLLLLSTSASWVSWQWINLLHVQLSLCEGLAWCPCRCTVSEMMPSSSHFTFTECDIANATSPWTGPPWITPFAFMDFNPHPVSWQQDWNLLPLAAGCLCISHLWKQQNLTPSWHLA